MGTTYDLAPLTIMRWVISIFLIILACQANAATVRISVEGSATAFRVFDPFRGIVDLDPFGPGLNGYDRQERVTATQGRAVLSEAFMFGDALIKVTDCAGNLTWLCTGLALVERSTLAGFNYDFSVNTGLFVDVQFNASGLIYENDEDQFFWSNELGDFFGDRGIRVEYAFSSFRVEVIPLPGTAILLLGTLGALVMVRRWALKPAVWYSGLLSLNWRRLWP